MDFGDSRSAFGGNSNSYSSRATGSDGFDWTKLMGFMSGGSGGQQGGTNSRIGANPGYGQMGDAAMQSGNPIAMGVGAAMNMLGGGLDAASMGQVDYRNINNENDAKQAVAGAQQRGAAIGGTMGPLGKMLGGFIAQIIAKRKAERILNSQETKMGEILDYKRKKMDNNGFGMNQDLINEWI